MSNGSTRSRPIWPVATALLALASILGLLLWAWAAPSPKDHWQEVARARAYLDRGRPDLAFQTVSGIRDEAPGAAEALTVAARALLSRNDIPLARRALERSLKLQPKQADAAKMLAAI